MSEAKRPSNSQRSLEALLREVRAARNEDLLGEASRRVRGLARARGLVAGLKAVGEGRVREAMAHLAAALGEPWVEPPPSDESAAPARKGRKKTAKKTAKKAAKKTTKKPRKTR